MRPFPPIAPPRRLLDLPWRLAYRAGFPLARLWWRLRRAGHEGALVGVHVGPAVLLVRSSYRRAWNFPGGGVRRGERPDQAARRELIEEIGLDTEALQGLGVVSGQWEGRRDRVHLFALHLDRLPPLRLDGREIIGARLATPAQWRALPVTRPVALYLAALDASSGLPELPAKA